MKNLSSSYRCVRLNTKWCAHAFSKILLLLLFHLRPTPYEKVSTAYVSVHMLQVLCCYSVGVHITRSLRISGSIPPIQHVPRCRAKNLILFTKIILVS